SHLRSYADGRAPGMDELMVLAHRSGVAGHVSHYRGRAEPLAAHLDESWNQGLDVMFDSYPHLQANTILAMKGLPAAVCEGGVAAPVERRRDAKVRSEREGEWFAGGERDLGEATLAYIAAEEYRWAEGLTLSEATERAGGSFGAFCCEVMA